MPETASAVPMQRIFSYYFMVGPTTSCAAGSSAGLCIRTVQADSQAAQCARTVQDGAKYVCSAKAKLQKAGGGHITRPGSLVPKATGLVNTGRCQSDMII